MVEVEVAKFNSKGVCVEIKRYKLEDWYNLSKDIKFTYRAFQIGFHSLTIGK